MAALSELAGCEFALGEIALDAPASAPPVSAVQTTGTDWSAYGAAQVNEFVQPPGADWSAYGAAQVNGAMPPVSAVQLTGADCAAYGQARVNWTTALLCTRLPPAATCAIRAVEDRTVLRPEELREVAR